MLRSSLLHGRSLLSDLHIRHPCLAVPPVKSLPTEQLTAFQHLDGFLAEHPARWVGRRHTVHRWSRQYIRAFHERVNVHEQQRLQLVVVLLRHIPVAPSMPDRARCTKRQFVRIPNSIKPFKKKEAKTDRSDTK